MRFQIAPALAVDNCCPTIICARPVNPGSRRRKGGMPVTDRIGRRRGSCCTNVAIARSRSVWVSKRLFTSEEWLEIVHALTCHESKRTVQWRNKEEDHRETHAG